MVVYSFYIFDRHGPHRHLLPQDLPADFSTQRNASTRRNGYLDPPALPLNLSNQGTPKKGRRNIKCSVPRMMRSSFLGLYFPLGIWLRNWEDPRTSTFRHWACIRERTGLIGTNPSSFISYRTGHYKLHYYETPTSLKFVMVTDTKTNNLRIVLHQIYVSLYVEYGEFSR